MNSTNPCDVIIIGGSYSGLAAAMALGRALRTVLVIDSGLPCNRQTPQSHNFLTQDGIPPLDIAAVGKLQVSAYPTVQFLNALAIKGKRLSEGFEITTHDGSVYYALKLLFASGIQDSMPSIEAFSACWGISILHCPYCHGYEVRHTATGILGNGDAVFEFAKLLFNWTRDITLFTDGKAVFTQEQAKILHSRNISIDEKRLVTIKHRAGKMEALVFEDGSEFPLATLYARLPFTQHCDIPAQLGCSFTEEGYISTESSQKTKVPGVFACGDNCSRIRTVANAVSTGTVAGIMLNKEMIDESFQ